MPDLAAHIALTPVRRSLPEVIITIIKAGTSPSHIFRALMKCQWLVLETKLPELSKLPPDEQVQGLKSTIEHFNYIETSIIELGEQVWITEVEMSQKELESEREEHILAITSHHWKKDDNIKLLNYYKGLPVQAISKIIDVKLGLRPEITVRASDKLRRVLTISEKKQVLTPDSKDAVFINLEELYMTRDNITFCITGISPTERRKHLRLQPLRVISIELYRNKEASGCGEILDLSINHIDLSMPYSDTYPFNNDEIIDFQFQMNQNSLKGAGWVRSLKQNDDRLIICIEIMPDATLQRQLQQETSSIQRQIIQEIRQKFTPIS